jgi:hypothetical protein
MSESVELTESEKADLDSWAAAGVYLCGAADPCTGYHDQRPGHEHENLFDAVAELVAAREAAARREALLEAAEHCTARANEAHRCDLHVVSDTWDVAAVVLRALAEPERDEEGGRCTELTCPQHGPANRAKEESR